jgi:heme-degrading monooxygenase HmoA
LAEGLSREVDVILEVASLTIRPGDEAAFERAFARVEPLLRDARGYLSHELRRSVEHAQHYALLVEWQRLEDHTVNFVRSAAFDRLRALLRQHLQAPPEVEHFRAVPPWNERGAASD